MDILKSQDVWEHLYFYQKSIVLYQMTIVFCKRFLPKFGDRTVDQMVQAARSGKQNIVEASAAATTSSETEIKLMNVARASLHELLADYEDYLRVRGLEQWPADSQKAAQARRACMAHNDSAYYREAIQERSDETIANIAITLLHQEDVFLRKLIDRLQSDFLKQGGIREQMLHARLEYRKRER